MKLKIFVVLCFAAVFTVKAETPAQFTTWGKKASSEFLQQVKLPANFRRSIPANINVKEPKYSTEQQKNGFVLFVTNPFAKVYPETCPYSEQIDKPMRAFAAPGEFISLKFSVRALKNLRGIKVKVNPVKGLKKGGIPNANIDLRIVRTIPWADAEHENCYYLEPRYMEAVLENETFNLKAKHSLSFWISIKIPNNTKPGKYAGTVSITATNLPSQSLKLQMIVLPIKLAKIDPYKDIVFAMMSNDNDVRKGKWGKYLYSNNIAKHFADMREHGLNSTGYFHCNPWIGRKADGSLDIRFDRPGQVSKYSMNYIMELLNKSGLKGPFLYQKGPKNWIYWAIKASLGYSCYSPEFDQAFTAMTKAVVKQAKLKKWPEFIFLPNDEPGSHADRLKLGMYYGRLIKKAAPHIRTSNYFNGQTLGNEDWRYLAPVTDILCTNLISKAVLNNWKKLGYQQVWSYNTAGNTAPTLVRVAYGFHPWANGLRGVDQYIYQTGVDNPYQNLANRHFNFAYATPDGPLPSIVFESLRQGIIDYRYMLTLKKLIAKFSKGSREQQAAARAALKVLNEVPAPFKALKNESYDSDITRGLNSDALTIKRWRIAREIIKLNRLLPTK